MASNVVLDQAPMRPQGAEQATLAAKKAATCQMFETPLIERFSRIHPATPFVFWLPVLAFVGWQIGRAHV